MSSNSRDTSYSQFQAILDAALKDYLEKTGKDVLTDPLTKKLESCKNPDHVLDILQEQAQTFNEFRNGCGRMQLMRRLKPTIDVMFSLSNGSPRALGNAIGLTFPPAHAIFAGIGFLLAAAKGVTSDYDAIMDLFGCIESYLCRLRIFSEIPLALEGILIKIMAELLDVLALATRQVKQGRFKKIAKKMLGENEVTAVLHRLDRLTTEESRMTAAQTMEVVHGLFHNMKEVMGMDGKTSTDSIRDALVKMQEIAEGVNKTKRDELQNQVRRWLNPPDPSINLNVACGVSHKMTATWFTEGTRYKEWKAQGSLLWINGKPGSGKSVLCSSIIEDIEDLKKCGLASLAYYFFDFKDSRKQGRRGLLSSLLVQLSARSNASSEILNHLYSAHDNGLRQPSESDLIHCLKDVLAVNGQGKVYIIMDAVDECPNNFGTPASRENVLGLIEELVSSRPHVYLCVTSRPEVDIQIILEALASHQVSLHDEYGQQKDIVNYVKSVVESDPRMRKWREEEKELVIKTLARKADGMFRWVFCQLDTLRRCFPGSIRHALDELPRTLDETYERILLGIDEEKWEYAHRLLQCLAVSRRPLRAEELAEVLAVELDAKGMPKLNVDLRPGDADEAVLSACSALVAIIDSNTLRFHDYYDYNDYSHDFRIVQFSHYSVKEFLTCRRLKSSSQQTLSRFHVSPKPANTILAQSCISTLLQLVQEDDNQNFPLAEYAARNWVDHAQVHGVASRLQIGMESLFDPEKPHFAVWVDIRRSSRIPSKFKRYSLSCAALYGFDGVVKYLVTTRRQDTNAIDAECGTPLQAALSKGHHRVVEFLLEHGAGVDHPRDYLNRTPLLLASKSGKPDIVRLLLRWGADVNSHDVLKWTSLHHAAMYGHLDVVRQLIDFGADINARDDRKRTPLYKAFRYRNPNVLRLLLEWGADTDSWDNQGSIPLHVAWESERFDVVRHLIKFGANINICDEQGATPFQKAFKDGRVHILHVILERGVDVNALHGGNRSPLHKALDSRHFDVAKLFINFGADINSKDPAGVTPLEKAVQFKQSTILKLLLDRGVNVNIRDGYGGSPLHEALIRWDVNVVQQLIDLGADVNARNKQGATPLHKASQHGKLNIVRLLIEQGADVHARDRQMVTPLHNASRRADPKFVRVLLERGPDINARDHQGGTPLHNASQSGNSNIVRLLLEEGANINAQDDQGATPFHKASQYGNPLMVQLLLGKGADINARDNQWATPLHKASQGGNVNIVQLFLEQGADMNAMDRYDSTPLHEASKEGHLSVVQLLINIGADIHARNHEDFTPFQEACRHGRIDVIQLLLEPGVDVNTRDVNHSTPLHKASECGSLHLVQQLINFGADINAKDKQGATPLHRAIRSKNVRATQSGNSHLWPPLRRDSDLESRHLDVVQQLINSGADVRACDDQEVTPLHDASRLSDVHVVRLLLQSHVDVNTRDDGGSTPLHEASRNGCDEIIEMLHQRGANLDACDDINSTPLLEAISHGHSTAVKTLLESGADANARQGGYQNPLNLAVSKRNSDAARYLLTYGADPNAQIARNPPNAQVKLRRNAQYPNALIERMPTSLLTPLHLALQFGYRELVQLLLDHGANVILRERKP